MDLDPAHIQHALVIVIIILLSLALHEWGHAFMADRLGDDTPRSQGRVTLNPLVHIDPIGTVLIPLLGALGVFGSFGMIGWAKPVIINPDNLRQKGARSLVTIAGPAMNFLLALLAAVVAGLLSGSGSRLHELAVLTMLINVSLMVFNLLPIPPLDGSKFLMYWFGMKEETYASFARWGWLVLLVAINLPASQHVIGRIFQVATIPFRIVYGIVA
ncbi:Zn-dependent protease [Opitutaceae bacterium TAV1]|nr:peptidase M50 [Opitutaceae bacterium TAV5]EIP97258.1 Zn-dependent protease [Opitutaceae bacterium TAV1]